MLASYWNTLPRALAGGSHRQKRTENVTHYEAIYASSMDLKTTAFKPAGDSVRKNKMERCCLERKTEGEEMGGARGIQNGLKKKRLKMNRMNWYCEVDDITGCSHLEKDRQAERESCNLLNHLCWLSVSILFKHRQPTAQTARTMWLLSTPVSCWSLFVSAIIF